MRCNGMLILLLCAAAGQAQIRHRFLLADEGAQKVVFVDETAPGNDWECATPGGNRDMQLVGNNRVMVSTPAGGYYEIDLWDARVVKSVAGFGAVNSARRLADGHTLLAGDNLMGRTGVTVVELDSDGAFVKAFSYGGYSMVRLMRRTVGGTFLFGSDNRVVEGDESGEAIWSAAIGGAEHTYQALRLPNGNTLASAGYGAFVAEIAPDGALVRTIGGKEQPESDKIDPHFYAGFQVLANGHVVATNWQGHGTGHGASGIQVIEYDPGGTMVWHWKDTTRISSIHGVLVIDGCDTERLYDDLNGVLAAVNGSVQAVRQPHMGPAQARRSAMGAAKKGAHVFDLLGREHTSACASAALMGTELDPGGTARKRPLTW